MQHMQTPNNNRFFVPQYELLGVVRCEELVSCGLHVVMRREGGGKEVNILFFEFVFC